MRAICGLDCAECEWKDVCPGCVPTNGRPSGGDCVLVKCCRNKKYERCADCSTDRCELKAKLIAEFNALKIDGMGEVVDLNPLKGSFVNLEYAFPSGQTVRIWDDDKIYLGTQLPKLGSDRCFGLAADETYLLVSEYGAGGSDPKIILFQRRNRPNEPQ